MSLSLSHRGAVSSVESAGCCGTVPLTGAVGGCGTVGGKFWSGSDSAGGTLGALDWERA